MKDSQQLLKTPQTTLSPSDIMLLGIADLAAGMIVSSSSTWMPAWFASFASWFLIIKGITTFTGPMIWFGPLSFFAGVIDLIVGISLYVAQASSGIIVQIVSLLAVILIMKGAMTVLYGLIA